MFGFGIETEYLLVHKKDNTPLSYKELTFDALHDIIDTIPLDGIPNIESLDLEDFHRSVSPYVIEGYAMWEEAASPSKIVGFLPKGIEIRTPAAANLDESLNLLENLFIRLQSKLAEHDLMAVSISHHPKDHSFKGPRGNRIDTWMSAQNAMTSFGPDINISLPEDHFKRIASSDYEEKFNYYAAPMISWALSSPFKNNTLWKIRDQIGRSYRTFKRSIDAPAIKKHLGRNPRFEFKAYEMSNDLQDFKNYILLFMTVLLDDTLLGRATRAERIYELGEVAVKGLSDEWFRSKLSELLESAENTLPKYGFCTNSLKAVSTRLSTRKTPADEMVESYLNRGQSIDSILKNYSILKPLNNSGKDNK